MATAARNEAPGAAEYRFPPGFQRNLLWFAFRKFRPANPILLFQHLAQEYGDIAHYKIGWHHIVFLNRRDEKDPGLYRFSKEAASSYFSQSLFTGTQSYAAQASALDHLLEAEVFELCYSDLNWAVQRLHALAVTGR